MTNISEALLFPTVLVLCFFGGYVTKNSFFDLKVMVLAGIIGLVFRWFSIPAAPFLIGFILGPLLEGAFRETLQQNQGDVSAFFTSWISLAFWALSAFSLYLIIRKKTAK